MKTPTEPRRVALTGATGFIGRHLSRALLAGGHSVQCLVRPGREEALPVHSNLQPTAGDLEAPEALKRLVSGCDTVIHLAGATGGRSYAELAATNVTGTGRLLETVREVSPGAHFIQVSSLAAREPGLSWYARSKRAGENLVTTDSGAWTVVRPPAVYGPGDPALEPLWRSLARGWLLQIGPAGQRFSLVHVEDLAEALTRLTDLGATRRILTIQDARSDGYDWPELARVAARRRGKRIRRLRIPAGLLAPAARYNLHVSRKPGPVLIPGKLRELAHPDWVCDNKALAELLDWQPALDLADRLDSLPGWHGMR